MILAAQHPWILWLMPLTLLPFLSSGMAAVSHPGVGVMPRDPVSILADWGQRACGALLIAALLGAISSPYRPPYPVERIGRGAHMVLLLDRSRSMDQPFAGHASANPLGRGGPGSKGNVARELLSEFVANRRNDRFAMVAFSTQPIQVLPLTGEQSMVQAAIQAGNVGRGLAQTDVGAGLIQALGLFEGNRYTGSRIIMLISDGGATLDLTTRYRITNEMRRQRASLYWIYLRSRNSPGLTDGMDAGNDQPTAPARALHHFFSDMGTPYRVYDAENPMALQGAIADVNRLQNLPIHYQHLVPRKDLTGVFYGGALILTMLLLLARLTELHRWR